MKQVTKQWVGGLVLVALGAAPVIAAAQSRIAIVRQPAVVAAPVVPVSTAPAAARSATRAVPQAIIIVAPTPLPPLPPNFCFRGNSAGVSRC